MAKISIWEKFYKNITLEEIKKKILSLVIIT